MHAYSYLKLRVDLRAPGIRGRRVAQCIGRRLRYEALPVGLQPLVLFSDTRNILLTAIEVARSAAGAQLVWTVKGDDVKKWVRPCGIAIVSTSLVVLQASLAYRVTV